jgi:hypothetical protein
VFFLDTLNTLQNTHLFDSSTLSKNLYSTSNLLVTNPSLETYTQLLSLTQSLNVSTLVTNASIEEVAFITNFSYLVNQLYITQNTPEVTLPETFYAVSGDRVFDDYHEYALYRLDLELTRRQKLRPDLTKEQIFKLMNGVDSESVAYFLEEFENEPAPDKSNIFRYKGQNIDVTKLSEQEIFHYLSTLDDATEFKNLEHVRTMFHVTTPNEVLHYPEPFIASASFIHEELHFLHIIHYQFWL